MKTAGILVKLSVFVTICHEIKWFCTLGQGYDAKALSVLSELPEGWIVVQRSKTLGRTQVAHASIDNQPPYSFIMHFESKICKIQACTTSCGSSTRWKSQQHKAESGLSSWCARSADGNSACTLHLAGPKGLWLLHGRGKSLCMFTADCCGCWYQHE